MPLTHGTYKHNATYSWNLYIMPLIHGIYNDQSHRNRKQCLPHL